MYTARKDRERGMGRITQQASVERWVYKCLFNYYLYFLYIIFLCKNEII